MKNSTRFKVDHKGKSASFPIISEALTFAHGVTSNEKPPAIHDTELNVIVNIKPPQRTGTMTQRLTYSVMVAKELEEDYNKFLRNSDTRIFNEKPLQVDFIK